MSQHCNVCGKNLKFVETPITVGEETYCSESCQSVAAGDLLVLQDKDRRKDLAKERNCHVFLFALGLFMLIAPWLAFFLWLEIGGRFKPIQMLITSGLGAVLIGYAFSQINKISLSNRVIKKRQKRMKQAR